MYKSGSVTTSIREPKKLDTSSPLVITAPVFSAVKLKIVPSDEVVAGALPAGAEIPANSFNAPPTAFNKTD